MLFKISWNCLKSSAKEGGEGISASSGVKEEMFVLSFCHPLPAAHQRFPLKAQVEEEGVMVQKNGSLYAPGEMDLGPSRIAGNIGPRNPNKATEGPLGH